MTTKVSFVPTCNNNFDFGSTVVTKVTHLLGKAVVGYDDDGNYILSNGDVIKEDVHGQFSYVEKVESEYKMDLSDVSTRDLLNEVFRRGAIKQIKRSGTVEPHNETEDYIQHFSKALVHDSVTKALPKLKDMGVFNVEFSNGVVTSDFFICLHPLTLKENV